MNIFKAIQPSNLLTAYIREYWYFTLDNIMQTSQRMLPSGSVGIYFLLKGTQISSANDIGMPPASYLYGQTTIYDTLSFSGTVSLIAVIFRTAAIHAFFNISPDEMTNQRITLDVCEDNQLVELNKRLPETKNISEAIEYIENYFIKRLQWTDLCNVSRMDAVIRSIHSGIHDVSTLAGKSCLGYKQFKRVFTCNIGLNPKEYIRVIRFRQAIYLLQKRQSININQLAEECGYYDKSHLIKDFKEFSGHSPTGFLSVCEPFSEYHSLFRSVFLDNPL